MLRCHAQTAGVSLTAQQPYNNVVRVAVQALAAILGGTNSLHTNSLDETLALPSEHAVLIALRTQQIIAAESGVVNTVDPLAGSYFVEKLTDDMERGAFEYFDRIDGMGGMIAAIDAGFPQKEIQESAYQFQKALERKEKIMVGINDYTMEETHEVPILFIDDSVEKKQSERLSELRRRRDNRLVMSTLEALKAGARGKGNTMSLILDCVRAYATLGEICDALKEVFGIYEEPAF
jgi:methylmalonyl-CoA mutase N-terminal domain/subunit